MVVSHLNDKDNGCTGCCDEIGDEKEDSRADALLYAQHQSLTHKAEAAQRHHAESWQRNAVGLSGANGLNGLWQIAQYQAYTT